MTTPLPSTWTTSGISRLHAQPRSPSVPFTGTPGPAGRGLVIVDALTNQWGYARTHSGGKIVWARIAAPHP
ncbi:hypothetical protein ACWGJB_44590 [Streptomyces sp. NPDC054813]